MSNDEHEVWIRFDADVSDSYVSLFRQTFRVLRHTKAGVWLDHWGTPKFVLNDARKRFAYPTDELAMASFVIRKRKQEGILAARLRQVQEIRARIDADGKWIGDLALELFA